MQTTTPTPAPAAPMTALSPEREAVIREFLSLAPAALRSGITIALADAMAEVDRLRATPFARAAELITEYMSDLAVAQGNELPTIERFRRFNELINEAKLVVDALVAAAPASAPQNEVTR